MAIGESSWNFTEHKAALWGHLVLQRQLVSLGKPVEEIFHDPEGRTIEASLLRGHSLAEAAKSMIIDVRLSKNRRQFVNAVVRGDHRVDFDKVADFARGKRAGLASVDQALRLTGCPMGTVIPFSFNTELMLVVDIRILELGQIVFNAGVLDRSFVLSTDDYLAAASPHLVAISSAQKIGSMQLVVGV